MYNIVFLDIDGVLNRYGGLQLLGWKIARVFNKHKWYSSHTKHPFEVRERYVKRLAKIINKSGAKVVLTASCRNRYFGIKYEDKDKNMQIIEDLFRKYNIDVIDKTCDSFNGNRGKQITDWIIKNKHLWSRYVILDDEAFELNRYTKSKFVKVNGNTGLTMINVYQTLAILNA